MDQRIKELAEQYACHTETMTGVETEYIFDIDDLFEFAELIRADEREAIIDICEDVEVFDETMRTITEAIRQRGEK